VAAKALNLPIQTTPWFTRKGTQAGITSHTKIVNTAFSADVLAQGNNSDLIALKDNTLVVLRVTDHQLAKEKPLPEVRQEIIAQLVKQQAQAAAKKLSSEILAKLNANESSAAMLRAHGLTWSEAKTVSRDDKSLSQGLLSAAFDQPAPNQHANYGVTLLPNGNYAVIAVEKVLAPPQQALKKQEVHVIAHGIAQHLGLLDYELYVNSVKAQAKIKRYQHKQARGES
jgi:hypothetical protein